MGTFENLRTLASLWIDSKKRTLQEGTPSTKVDSGGTKQGYSFQGQEIDRSELREIKEIRESGGVISHLVHAKALMQFGTGAEFEAEEDEVAEYCEDQFDNLDNLLIEIGEDAIWYPYSIGEVVETRGGGFSHVELVEPWTMLPVENQYGEVVQWEQEIQAERGGEAEIFDPDEIASFILNKSSGRDKTGISEVKRAEQEITSYRKHSNAIDEVVDSAAWRRHLWKVGRDNGAVVDDNELRRFRNRVDNLEGDTQLVMGKDIEHELMDAMNPESFATITEHDLRKLSLALGLPLELANVGSDGLGSGMPAELRMTLFERQARAAQRSLTDQFVEQVVRPVLDKYSPYPRDADISLNLGDPVQANDQKQNMINSIGDDMTVNERRAVFDKAPLDDDEEGEAFKSPGEEDPGAGPAGAAGGDMGFFSEEYMRALQTPEGVPENAISINDPSEAPEGAQTVQGPGGGLYYVPAGEGGDGDGEGPPPTVDLENEVDAISLDEAGIKDGSNHDGMRIAQLEDGSEVFVEEDYEKSYAEPELLGATVHDQLGVDIPEHHYYEDEQEMAKEGVNGNTIRQIAEGDIDVDVDEESLRDAYAATLVAGDTDMHWGNMMVREDGEVVPVDVEMSGGPVREKGDNKRKIENQGLDFLDTDVTYDDIWERAEEMAGELDTDALPEAETDFGETARENIVENAEAIQA